MPNIVYPIQGILYYAMFSVNDQKSKTMRQQCNTCNFNKSFGIPKNFQVIQRPEKNFGILLQIRESPRTC